MSDESSILQIGTLYPSHNEVEKGESSAMFMQIHAGTATQGENTYSCGNNMGNGSMIVESEKTKRKFVISWEDVIRLAIERGIDGTDKIPNPLDDEKS